MAVSLIFSPSWLLLGNYTVRVFNLSPPVPCCCMCHEALLQASFSCEVYDPSWWNLAYWVSMKCISILFGSVFSQFVNEKEQELTVYRVSSNQWWCPGLWQRWFSPLEARVHISIHLLWCHLAGRGNEPCPSDPFLHSIFHWDPWSMPRNTTKVEVDQWQSTIKQVTCWVFLQRAFHRKRTNIAIETLKSRSRFKCSNIRRQGKLRMENSDKEPSKIQSCDQSEQSTVPRLF